ncbi:hypothetical protein [Solirubrobacter soli]|uniref:hypothetical protein n=1 Tax=Solirubrobacter soli TaxID=363832 RepID=UPI0004021269|nr:hypothetical protein [Solirubrobacter soli]
MSDLLLVAGLPADVVNGAPGISFAGPRALSERDEFGALDGPVGLFRAPLEPAALQAREDLGHVLCAWLPREDLL